MRLRVFFFWRAPYAPLFKVARCQGEGGDAFYICLFRCYLILWVMR